MISRSPPPEQRTPRVRNHRRKDELREQARQWVPLIRPTVLEEADYRVDRFDRSLEEKWPDSEPEPVLSDPFRPVHRIHRFLVRRAESVEAQLAGREKGHEFLERADMGQEPPKPPASPEKPN